MKLKEGVEPMSGIYCGNRLYVTPSGKQKLMGIWIPSEMDCIGNPAMRAKRIIELCVSDIQGRMHDVQEAMAQYRAIRARVSRDYKKCCELITDDRKLREAIVNGYYQDLRKRPSKRHAERELVLEMGFT